MKVENHRKFTGSLKHHMFGDPPLRAYVAIVKLKTS